LEQLWWWQLLRKREQRQRQQQRISSDAPVVEVTVWVAHHHVFQRLHDTLNVCNVPIFIATMG
jgi:hypothetical protein